MRLPFSWNPKQLNLLTRNLFVKLQLILNPAITEIVFNCVDSYKHINNLQNSFNLQI